MKLTKELEQLRHDLGILQEVDCSVEENEKYRKMLQENETLPDGIVRREGEVEYASFYRLEKTILSKEELAEYLQCRQLKAIETIKKCVVFFTVLTIISLVCALFSVLSLLS